MKSLFTCMMIEYMHQDLVARISKIPVQFIDDSKIICPCLEKVSTISFQVNFGIWGEISAFEIKKLCKNYIVHGVGHFFKTEGKLTFLGGIFFFSLPPSKPMLSILLIQLISFYMYFKKRGKMVLSFKV